MINNAITVFLVKYYHYCIDLMRFAKPNHERFFLRRAELLGCRWRTNFFFSTMFIFQLTGKLTKKQTNGKKNNAVVLNIRNKCLFYYHITRYVHGAPSNLNLMPQKCPSQSLCP